MNPCQINKLGSGKKTRRPDLCYFKERKKIIVNLYFGQRKILIIPEPELPTLEEKCVRFPCSVPKCTSQKSEKYR